MHVIETGLTVALVVLLSASGWAVFVLFSPYRKCRWCSGTGRWMGQRCWRCKGTRLARRAGAGLVHKVKLSLRQAWDDR
ncbi:MAG TPA: hypothetical protein VGH57_16475 [Amycolatopsis sp.]|jgi:hypothetical protein